MKVILTTDVPKVGRKYEVREVAPGFARNYLFAGRLAVAATPHELKRHNALRERQGRRAQEEEVLLREKLGELENVPIVITKKANEKGSLFEGIDREDIRKLLDEKFTIHLPPDAVYLLKPIKEIGTFSVPILAGEKKGTITLCIKPES